MTVFPDITIGDLVTADLLDSMLPKTYVKLSSTGRAATTTLADDPELNGIPLAIGSYHVRLVIRWTVANASPDLKTRWGFTGTWNNTSRLTIGPGLTNTAAATAVTPLRFADAATNADAAYGGLSGPYTSTEEAYDVVVTVAGSLSLQWAQFLSDAGATTVNAGTAFEVRRTG
jgi:hypothetical protein